MRFSLDCKAILNIGEFSRGGKSRQKQQALDHDFAPSDKLTPFGILEPSTGKSYIWMTKSPATSDFMVDCIEDLIDQYLALNPAIIRFVINSDNGSECSGRRTQWLKRIDELSSKKKVTIQLAYYPPYHSKYNPVERLWGILENHWNGEIINSCKKALGLARTMTYKGISPVVTLVRKAYHLHKPWERLWKDFYLHDPAS